MVEHKFCGHSGRACTVLQRPDPGLTCNLFSGETSFWMCELPRTQCASRELSHQVSELPMRKHGVRKRLSHEAFAADARQAHGADWQRGR